VFVRVGYWRYEASAFVCAAAAADVDGLASADAQPAGRPEVAAGEPCEGHLLPEVLLGLPDKGPQCCYSGAYAFPNSTCPEDLQCDATCGMRMDAVTPYQIWPSSGATMPFLTSYLPVSLWQAVLCSMQQLQGYGPWKLYIVSACPEPLFTSMTAAGAVHEQRISLSGYLCPIQQIGM